MEKQDKTPKTRMEKVCNALGLEIYQLFNVSSSIDKPCSPYVKDNPYFFTEYGACNGAGEFAPEVLAALADGSLDIEPLEDYRYKHIEAVSLERLQGRKIKVEVASMGYAGKEKALYAVAAIGEPGISWRVETYEGGTRTGHKDYAELAQAVDSYNREKIRRMQY